MLLVSFRRFDGDGAGAEKVDVGHFARVRCGQTRAGDESDALGEETADAEPDDGMREVAVVEEVVLERFYLVRGIGEESGRDQGGYVGGPGAHGWVEFCREEESEFSMCGLGTQAVERWQGFVNTVWISSCSSVHEIYQEHANRDTVDALSP